MKARNDGYSPQKDKINMQTWEAKPSSSPMLLVSNWILTSHQPHRVTSAQANSVISKYAHFKTLLIYINLCQVNPRNQLLCNMKQNIHMRTSNTNFRRVSPSNITPVRRAHKARTCWYYQPFHLIYWYKIKGKYNIRMDGNNFLHKCIMANTSAIWQQAAHTVYQLQFPSCSATAIQKSLTFNEKCMTVF